MWGERREAGFIDMYELWAATFELCAETQKLSSLQRTALFVAGRLLSRPPSLREGDSDANSVNAQCGPASPFVRCNLDEHFRFYLFQSELLCLAVTVSLTINAIACRQALRLDPRL